MGSLGTRGNSDTSAMATSSDSDPSLSMSGLYDPDVFDSMAVVNSELWNEGEEEEETGTTLSDLLPHGASSLSVKSLQSIFLRAAQAGTLEAIKVIHEHCGPSIIHTSDEDKYTALHRASYNGHTSVIEYLLRHGGNVNSRTVDGLTPLHSACRWNKARAASLLLQNGANINSLSNGGQTPLHAASLNNRAKNTLELLLRHKQLDLSPTTGQGDTALALAERNGNCGYLFEMADQSCDHRKFLKSYPLKESTD